MSKTKSTAKANFEKTPLKAATKVANKLIKKLEAIGSKSFIAGSIRRGKEMIGDVDIVVIPDNIDTFLENVKEVVEYEYGGKKKVFGMFEGRPINLFLTTNDSFGACIYQCTGPAMYNVFMRSMAKKKGFKLNEYGLFNRDTEEKIAGPTEQSIFEAMNMNYLDPNRRKSPIKR